MGRKLWIANEAKDAPARAYVKKVTRMCKLLEAKWQTTLVYASKHYDKKHTPRTFSVRDKVWLNGKNIKIIRLLKKLDYKYFGSFVVFKPIRKQAYWLDLSKTFWRIYNVFHISFFELYGTPLKKRRLSCHQLRWTAKSTEKSRRSLIVGPTTGSFNT